MENKSNISEISEKSSSNFTHFSDETMSNISDISTSKVNYEDFSANPQILKQAQRIDFWNTYSEILDQRLFDKGYSFASFLLEELDRPSSRRDPHDLPEEWVQTVRKFVQGAGVMKKSQKAYYKALARCCMSQCLYFADGRFSVTPGRVDRGSETEREFLKKCIDLLLLGQQELQPFKSKQARLLQLKIICSLCVFAIKTGNQEFWELQKGSLLEFLEAQKDSGQRAFEIKAAIQLLLNSPSVETFGAETETEVSGVGAGSP